MINEQEMLTPLVLAEVREGLEVLGYSIDTVRAEGGGITVVLKNGRSCHAAVPHIVNVFDVALDITVELDQGLQG